MSRNTSYDLRDYFDYSGLHEFAECTSNSRLDYESGTENKINKVMTHPNWKKFKTDCICTDAYVCLKCRRACCDNAKSFECVCLYAYNCKDHTKGKTVCYGSHS